MTEPSPPDAAFWSIHSASARRSLMMCAGGALTGLAIAGLGLFTAHGTRTATVPAEDVALVNQVPLLMSDYVQQLRAVYDVPLDKATPAQRRKVLSDMIREELFVQRGVELGLQADTTEVRAALVGGVEAQSAADATMAQPTEAELRGWYASHAAQFANEGVLGVVDRILPPGSSPEQVAALVAAVKQGDAQADRLAPRNPHAAKEAEFYFAAKLHLGDALFNAAKGLNVGQVAPPITLLDGVHVLVVTSNVRPQPQPYELIRDRVLAAYVDDQAKRLTAANERFLQKRADVQIAKGYE